MKPGFTLIALLLAGAAGAQTESFRMPPQAPYLPESMTMHIPVGTKALLGLQQAREQQKSTAMAYRMTGNSRFDFETQRYIDSNYFAYSGSRGTHFNDEYQNLLAGATWSHSRPDYFVNTKTPGQGRSMEIANRYNTADAITESIYRMGPWTGKYEHTYDAAGNVTKMIVSDSGAAGWRADGVYFYSYDAAGQRISDSNANIQTNTPVSVTRYHYTAGGKLDTTESRRWNGVALNTDYMLISTYDAAGNLASSTNYYLDEDNVLRPGERFEYTYNSASLLQASVRSAYEAGIWEIRDRDSVGYTGTRPLFTYMKQESWDQSIGIWRPLREWNYVLDAQGRWGTEYFRDRNGSGALVERSKMIIDYNAGGLVTAARGYRYLPAQGSYDTNPYEQDRFYYEAYQTTSAKPEAAAVAMTLYPNPATSQLRIKSHAGAIERLAVISAAGQRISVPVVSARSQQVDVTSLPAGVYQLQVSLETGATQQLRFVKL